jgi:ubiquinone/menaquinone biosynthesis C-methylase UbiE
MRQRFFAWLFHNYLSDLKRPAHDNRLTRDVRAPLLAQAWGTVLEIGVGDGANLPLYPPGVQLTLLDANPYMLRYIPALAEKHNLHDYRLVHGHAEHLQFPDAHFDTVVATHVLCSVDDPVAVLSEVRRVLSPDGMFLFMEHVAAEPYTRLHRTQKLINPIWRIFGDGCNLTRATGTAIQAAGFREVEIHPFVAENYGVVGPHIVGKTKV